MKIIAIIDTMRMIGNFVSIMNCVEYDNTAIFDGNSGFFLFIYLPKKTTLSGSRGVENVSLQERLRRVQLTTSL